MMEALPPRRRPRERDVNTFRRLSGSRRRSARFDWSSFLAKLGPVVAWSLSWRCLAFLRPRTFLTMDNLQIMLEQTAVVGIAALGMTLIIISGGIDLSIGSNIALCTVAIARDARAWLSLAASSPRSTWHRGRRGVRRIHWPAHHPTGTAIRN